MRVPDKPAWTNLGQHLTHKHHAQFFKNEARIKV